ncbi:MAG: WbqC family protein [Cyclobacteriaceae bacterium]
MKLAIMQPYFLPYIGYFQLIDMVDKFVIYDNIQFTKKGWINRNRILVNGSDEFITIPLKKDSDYVDIDKRHMAETFEEDKQKILRRIKEAYRKAPYFEKVFPFTEDIFNNNTRNLFYFVFNSVKRICEYMEINTEFVVSSSIDVDHSLKSEQKVLAIATKMNAQVYINPIGGKELYSAENFRSFNIELKFIRSDLFSYKQFNHEFVPWLSILDVMMFNSKDEIKKMLNFYNLE